MSERIPDGEPGRPLLFLHLPKTGGTTMRKHLERLWGPRAVLSVYGLSAERAFAANPLPGEPVRAVFTHGRIACFLAHPQAPRSTMLRHPVDRMLSQYRFARDWSNHEHHAVAMEMGPVEFARAQLAGDHADGQTWLLSQGEEQSPALLAEARANLAEMRCVGLSEHFDESLALLCLELDIDPVPYARRNTSFDRAGDELGAADRAAIAAANPYDTELFAEAEARFHDEWRAAGPEAVRALAAIRRERVSTRVLTTASNVRARARQTARRAKARIRGR